MKKGFTLVELVITIAIVIILSVVSVPIYRIYIEKAMYTEGYALLGTVLSAQKSYYSEYGNFLRSVDSSAGNKLRTTTEPILGIDARGNKYFTYFEIGASEGGDSPKYYLFMSADKPSELRKDGTSQIYLSYNITSGPIGFKER